MIRVTALALLLLAPATALAQEAPTPPPREQAAEAGSPEVYDVPIPEVRKKVKKGKVAKVFQGSWEVVLPPQLERMVRVMTMALDGADDAAFADMNLNDEERTILEGVRTAIAATPADQQEATRQMLRSQVDEMLASFVLTVTADEITMSLQGETLTSRWTVVEAAHNRLVIDVEDDSGDGPQMTIHFADADHIVMASDTEEQRMAWSRKEP